MEQGFRSAEEPLPRGGSCLLGSINLAEFVTNDKHIDYDALKYTVKVAIWALNDVLNEGLPLHPLEEQRQSVGDWRQVGLGIMGLSDMLIKMGLTYGSPESIEVCDKIGFFIADTAMRQSARMAKEYGAFPKCNKFEVASTDFFIQNTEKKTKDLVFEYGLYNSQLLTIAPTGTLSTMLGISGGIEPIFANSYTRTTKSLHGTDVTYKVYTPIVQKYMKDHNINDEAKLPNFFVTAQDINYRDRIAMQSVWQKHIDASISSTVNLPNSATKEDVFNLYVEAWKAGLKGITIFRDGCDRVAILNTPEDRNTTNEITTSEDAIPRGTIMSVPEDLNYKKFKLHTGCGKLYFFVGYDDNGVIYDCFTNTDGTGGCTINTQAVSRLLSACIRGGVPVEYIVEQLQKAGTCPSFQYARGKGKKLSKGSSCPSAIGYVLKSIVDSFDIEKAEEAMEELDCELVEEVTSIKPTIHNDNKKVCPDCGADIVYEGGCNVCKSCGWSKCS